MKSLKSQPISVNLAGGFAPLAFEKTDTDGKGIQKAEFEAHFSTAARVAYSKLVPGLVVIHCLNVKLAGSHSTVLACLKFSVRMWNPRKATPLHLKSHIRSRLQEWGIEATDKQVEADIAHLLMAPSENEMLVTYCRAMAQAA